MTTSLPMIELSGGPLLRGECSKCGSCCVVEQDGVPYTCTHLIQFDRVGEPKATVCGVYLVRKHWMPIRMEAPGGRWIDAHCAAHGTEQETLAIIRNGIGKGCSLEVVC
jgi:hypothetical protein